MNTEKRYIHSDDFHKEDKSPKIICPVLYNIFKPKSVVDIGCGIGNFLNQFKKLGVEKILGLDGIWADKYQISNNISLDNFIEYNLDEVFTPNQKYDIAISLEVAEHIDEKYADNFIKTLTNCSDNIVFSAAIPLQGGQNHLNEQWNNYWIKKFELNDYVCMDFLRNEIWDYEDVFWWYKQNILFFTKTPEKYLGYQLNKLSDPIHKELFNVKTKELEKLRGAAEKIDMMNNGGYPLSFYFSIIKKKIYRKFKKDVS